MLDKAGNVYKTIKIGGQTWMAQNMAYQGDNVTCYANTVEAPYGDPDFIAHYGCLYNWEDAQKVCPDGWHLPTGDEFTDLLNSVGDSGKNRSQNLRASDFDQGKDTYGFGALAAGLHYRSSCHRLGEVAQFWSGEEYMVTSARHLVVDSESAELDVSLQEYGFSVRCLKDASVTE